MIHLKMQPPERGVSAHGVAQQHESSSLPHDWSPRCVIYRSLGGRCHAPEIACQATVLIGWDPHVGEASRPDSLAHGGNSTLASAHFVATLSTLLRDSV